MYRAAKNKKGIIICIAVDESQSGNYPSGSSAKNRMGTWCKFTVEEIPAHPFIPEAPRGLHFKENADKDGIELRSEEEIIKNPIG